MRLLLVVAGVACIIAGRLSHETLLDDRLVPYFEDAVVPRSIAAVRATLRERQGAVRLDVEVGALGAGVEPVPGLEGVQGANLRTAEELHALLQAGALELRTRRDGSDLAGALHDVRTGHLPSRRLLPDGALELDATTPFALTLAATFRSAELPAGTSHTYVLAGGVPRLVVTVQRTGARARIAAIESLGEHHPAAARRKP